MIKIRNIIPFYSIILLFLALNGGCKDSSVVNNINDPACNIDPDMLQTAESSYSGAEICKGCHGAIYSDWAASGHAFKINPVKNGVAPVYPNFVSSVFAQTGFTNPPTAEGNPGDPSDNINSWSDITYVLGGYAWYAVFMGPTGHILTGGTGGSTESKYEMDRLDLADTAVATSSVYDAGTAYPSLEYNCGRCHTTGWKSKSMGQTNQQQDFLSGIDGTWDAHTIECEYCHGNGSQHVSKMQAFLEMGDSQPLHIVKCAPTTIDGSLDRIDGFADNLKMNGQQICADCHSRNEILTDSGGVETENGYMANHGQSNEMEWSPGHRKIQCTTCHNPHRSGRYDPDGGYRTTVVNLNTGNCAIKCHKTRTVSSYVGTGKGKHTCINCHMPRATKIARNITLRTLTNDAAVASGDIRTHIFAINPEWTDSVTDMGMDLNGKTELKELSPGSGVTALSLDLACMTCHNAIDAGTNNRAPRSVDEARAIAKMIHPEK